MRVKKSSIKNYPRMAGQDNRAGHIAGLQVKEHGEMERVLLNGIITTYSMPYLCMRVIMIFQYKILKTTPSSISLRMPQR